MARLRHFDSKGAARMVDVGAKPRTDRVAVAKASVHASAETIAQIEQGRVGKGDVLGIARLAGIQAAKRTPELIPLAHPVALTSVALDLVCDAKRAAIDITATCAARDRTGVEMEALTAVCVASLTVYDMCKSIDRRMRIGDIRLTKKTGGKSGKFQQK